MEARALQSNSTIESWENGCSTQYQAAEQWVKNKLESNWKLVKQYADEREGVVPIVVDHLVVGRGFNGINLYATLVGAEAIQNGMSEDTAQADGEDYLLPPKRSGIFSSDVDAARFRSVVAQHSKEPQDIEVGGERILHRRHMVLGSDEGLWSKAFRNNVRHPLAQHQSVFNLPYWPATPAECSDTPEDENPYLWSRDLHAATTITTMAYNMSLYHGIVDMMTRTLSETEKQIEDDVKVKVHVRFCPPEVLRGKDCFGANVYAKDVDILVGGGDHTVFEGYDRLVNKDKLMTESAFWNARAAGQLLGSSHAQFHTDEQLRELYKNETLDVEWVPCNTSSCDVLIVGTSGAGVWLMLQYMDGENAGVSGYQAMQDWPRWDVQNRVIGNLYLDARKETNVDNTRDNGSASADLLEYFRKSTNPLDHMMTECGNTKSIESIIGQRLKVTFLNKNSGTCIDQYDSDGYPYVIVDRIIFATPQAPPIKGGADPEDPNGPGECPGDCRPLMAFPGVELAAGNAVPVGNKDFGDSDWARLDGVLAAENSTVSMDNETMKYLRFWGLASRVSPQSADFLYERYMYGRWLGDAVTGNGGAGTMTPVIAEMNMYFHNQRPETPLKVLPKPNLNGDFEISIKHYVHKIINPAEQAWINFLLKMRVKKLPTNGAGLTKEEIQDFWHSIEFLLPDQRN
jgi:hypothetical protein